MRVISGFLKGRKIDGMNIHGTRPTMDRVKESVFASIQGKIDNSVCLDLFAGSGSLGIEAISNGARKVYFVDNNIECIKIINKNIFDFGIERKCALVIDDYNNALKFFKDKNIKFDLIFVDPPYRQHIVNDILKYISSNDLLNDGGIVICEIDQLYLTDLEINLEKYKEKKYGSTYVCFYRKK